MHLPIVDPPIPAAHGEAVERPDVVLALLAFLANPPVLGVVPRVWLDRAGEQERLSIRPPRRKSGARVHGRNAHCLAACGYIQHVDLVGLVVVAFRHEGEPAAVGTPCGTALAGFGERETARLGAAISR